MPRRECVQTDKSYRWMSCYREMGGDFRRGDSVSAESIKTNSQCLNMKQLLVIWVAPHLPRPLEERPDLFNYSQIKPMSLPD